ncbi:MAG: response regulator [Calditrichia bacterium]
MGNKEQKRQPHILITDDEQNMLESLEFILEAADYRVTRAQNGLQAFDIIRSLLHSDHPISLLITDIRMPLLSGTKLMERLNDEQIVVPTIVITEYESQRLKKQIQGRNERLFISKPFTERQLMDQIKEMLAEKKKINNEFASKLAVW